MKIINTNKKEKHTGQYEPVSINGSSVIEQVEVLPQKRYVGIPGDSVKFDAR